MEAPRPRASRSKKNLPAAFQGKPRHVSSPRLNDELRLDSLVFLSSCPQRHGHFAIKKMLQPTTLELFCLMEIPSSEHQKSQLRSWLHAWLSRWAKLQQQNPGLVALREAFWDVPQGYPMAILCEYMPLGSLHDLIQACGGLPEEAMREIAQAILEALDVLHSADPPMVHGCVKPSQVLFASSGQPKLTFGLEQRIKTCQVADVEQSVDIFDLGLLLLVSALGGMDVLLDAIPYARNMPRVETSEVLLHELKPAPNEIGYLPPASDLLFNRQYSGPFLGFVSTCLEATHCTAAELLRHEFLHAPPELPISLAEVQGLARLLNEAPDASPAVAQSAQLYLANIAQYIGPMARSGGRQWEVLITDTARSLGLARQVVQQSLEAHLERLR